MKLIFYMWMILLITSCTSKAKKNSLEQWLFRPDKILEQKEKLKLSQEQYQKIKGIYELEKPHYDSLNAMMKIQLSALEAVVKNNKADTAMALEKLDSVLHIERQMKLLQLKVYTYCKNQLTDEQINQLRKQFN